MPKVVCKIKGTKETRTELSYSVLEQFSILPEEPINEEIMKDCGRGYQNCHKCNNFSCGDNANVIVVENDKILTGEHLVKMNNKITRCMFYGIEKNGDKINTLDSDYIYRFLGEDGKRFAGKIFKDKTKTRHLTEIHGNVSFAKCFSLIGYTLLEEPPNFNSDKMNDAVPIIYFDELPER